MKKLLLIISTLSISTIFGQTEQGGFLIGAYGNLNSSISKTTYDLSNEKATTSLISGNLKGGYFLIDNLTTGLQASYSTQNLKYESFDHKESSKYYSISLFSRYYLLKGNVKPYFDFSLGLGNRKTKVASEISGDNESKSTFSFYNLGAGVAILLNKRISLDLGLNYGFSDFENEENGDSKTSSYSFMAGFSFYL